MFYGQFLYQMDKQLGIKGILSYNVNIVDQTGFSTMFIHTRSLAGGVVYAMSSTVAVMPYLQRNFNSLMSNSSGSWSGHDSSWAVGATFGAQF
jgi:hypothetical protein